MVNKIPGQTVTVNTTISYIGNGGSFLFEVSITPRSSDTVLASGVAGFTLSPAEVATQVTLTLTTSAIASTAPTSGCTVHVAIWDNPKSTSFYYYNGFNGYLTVYRNTTFSNPSLTVS